MDICTFIHSTIIGDCVQQQPQFQVTTCTSQQQARNLVLFEQSLHMEELLLSSQNKLGKLNLAPDRAKHKQQSNLASGITSIACCRHVPSCVENNANVRSLKELTSPVMAVGKLRIWLEANPGCKNIVFNTSINLTIHNCVSCVLPWGSQW
jgi:hypothetical protein